MSFTDVTIGVIGGSGLYDLPGLKVLGEIQPETPWGKPSDAIIVSQLGDIKIGFLARHGRGHYLSPSEVPFQANIAALKSIGVKVILAFSAVGSLREEIRPRDFVVPTQLIDRTKGIRKSTFFEDGVVGHVQFGDPFTLQLTELIYKTAETVEGLRTHYNKTLICMEGPQFSTRAESHLYRSWGCDIINMSVIPESKLAAEAEIAYAMVCMATDYDCWKESEEAVTLEMVLGNLSANAENARKLVQKLIPLVHKELQSPWVLQKQGTASGSICTAPQKRNPATLAKLGYLFKIQ
ncbi:nucleoside phosphorylase domain-containing protein [Gorgonomyces haynaldii]|nr:nucleoside phosphorylase domain-containing protein [Gorgonomyces haynaldii]